VNKKQSQLFPSTVNWFPVIDWNVKFYGAHRQQVPAEWSMPEETHNGFEIVLILEGTQETMMESVTYVLNEGDILLIPPGFKHVNRCLSDTGMTYFCAHFNVDDPMFRLEIIANLHLLYPSGDELNTKLYTVLDSWITLEKSDNAYTSQDRFAMQARLFELFGILTSVASNIAQGNHKFTPDRVHFARAIAEAIKAEFAPRFSNPALTADLKIESIISSLGISPRYGFQLFKDVYRISPRKYLSELKLQEAKLLIQQPELSLSAIAERLGYANLSHFSRQFKRWTGMSPLEYKKNVFKTAAPANENNELKK
jgi:AraC-like DNA-binding protein